MKTEKDQLGNRMKSYEGVSRNVLTKRIPVIVRVDGKAFSSFCKRFKKPFDPDLHSSLNHVMAELCESIQGAKFAERHSDEISILVTDFDDISTNAYFEYVVPKVCSVVVSMATAAFCKALVNIGILANESGVLVKSWPCFDCRAFNVPEDDVVNYFFWRQRDCIRNSISMYAQSMFSHKELMGKSCSEMQEMMWQKSQFNWAKLPQYQKTGWVCSRKPEEFVVPAGPQAGKTVVRNHWVVEDAPSNRPKLLEVISGIQMRKPEEKA